MGRAFFVRGRRHLGGILTSPVSENLLRRVQPAPRLACPTLATTFASRRFSLLPGLQRSGRSQSRLPPPRRAGHRAGEAVLGRGEGNDGRLSRLDTDIERLGAYCRVVLPRAIVGYRSWLRRCAESSDRPVARALGFALADVANDWERGTALVLRLHGCPWRGGRGGLCCSGVEPGGATACGPRPGPGRLAPVRRPVRGVWPVPAAGAGDRLGTGVSLPCARTLAFRGRGSYGVFHVQKTPDRCLDRRGRFLRCQEAQGGVAPGSAGAGEGADTPSFRSPTVVKGQPHSRKLSSRRAA